MQEPKNNFKNKHSIKDAVGVENNKEKKPIRLM